ncbi:patatin-like phospholipase family protein [Evansella clarkii]|uniref:patatin-like phospholipase family protein n=1 Tax=Evansella clarkii TaxID=79879 RepID=UPI000998B91D|nr:patatin-like phospholipase family protein [Evansella clarkii]
MKKVDGVFTGGGLKAFAFVGAIRELHKKGIGFERAAGTSAGALVAALIKAGYTSTEMEYLFEEMDAEQLLEPSRLPILSSFYRWLRVYKSMGLYKGRRFEDWVFTVLKQKGIITFGDLEPGSLKMIASDLTHGRLVVLPDDLVHYGLIPEQFSIARAVRMSCSLPFFFEPVKLVSNEGQRALVVDGGVLSNFPIWLFFSEEMKNPVRPVLGLRLSPAADYTSPMEIKNAFNMLHSLFETMRQAHDQRHIATKFERNIIFIPTEDIPVTQFSLDVEMKERLIAAGAKSTGKFLKAWSY